MIPLVAVAVWVIVLSLVAGLCASARAGDLAIPTTRAAASDQPTVESRPSQNRHVSMLSRPDHRDSSIECSGAGHPAPLARRHESPHPVHRIDRKLIASTRRRSRAVRELRRAACI